jgi:hypothetical protein
MHPSQGFSTPQSGFGVPSDHPPGFKELPISKEELGHHEIKNIHSKVPFPPVCVKKVPPFAKNILNKKTANF